MNTTHQRRSSKDSKTGKNKPPVVDQVATHLPDQVVNTDHKKKLPHQVTLQGVLLFLDISGFTALTEKYSMNAKNGTDQLTKTLNGYMHALVNQILTNDGDILQFAGDAILCLWEVESFLKMKATVYHCMRTARALQDKCGEYVTSAGVKLRVKVGIAAGEVMITFLGNNENCHIVTMGRAVTSVNEAEGWCVPGDIVVSPSAWCHCAGISVEIEKCDDDKHVKLLAFADNEESLQVDYEFVRTEQIEEEYANQLGINVENEVRRKSSTGYLMTQEPDVPMEIKPKKKQVLKTSVMRRGVARHFDRLTTQRLRLYVAAPVLRKLDDGQPLEYLSEMRQVSILFINLVLEVATKYEETVTLQALFNAIYKEISDAKGCLNKVFMFDKGCTFLAIFGLPGFKHENDCARALQCSEKIANECNEIPKVVKTSIGVTTGSSFCGVMGHTLRHEYTVIGRKVNMAARLMMYYPGKVTCDNETYHHAKLNKAHFTQLELKTMKGLQNVGTIREYKENKDKGSSMDFLKQQELEFPLIGRVEHMAKFMENMERFKAGAENAPQCIVLKGEGGIGKSRVLDAMVVKAMEEGTRVVMLTLHMVDCNTPYYAVRYLLVELLDLDMEVHHTERELYLTRKLNSNDIIIHDLPLLNDILNIKLRLSQKQMDMNPDERKSALHTLVFNIVELMVKKKSDLMFCLDDSHYMDQESWEFIGDLGKGAHSLVLLSLKTTSRSFKHPAAMAVLQRQTTVYISLDGLEPQYIGALACQLLAVTKIPSRLDDILRQRSHGLPAWCEQLLYSMLYDGLLNIEPYDPDEEYPEPLVAPEERFKVRKVSPGTHEEDEQPRREDTHKDSLSVPNKLSLTHSEMNAAELTGEDDLVCLFKEDFVMSDVRLPDSIKGMIQARIDGLSETDQMLVKTGAVLGLRFPRVMLDHLLDKRIPTAKVNEALARLAENGIFVCGQRNLEAVGPQIELPSINLEKRLSIVEKKFVFECNCAQNKTDAKVDHCLMLAFQTATIQETAYEMYTENLRRTLHVKAAEFMENQPHKCKTCGGTGVLLSEQVKPMAEILVTSEPTSSFGSGRSSVSTLPSVLARVRKLSYRQSMHRSTKIDVDETIDEGDYYEDEHDDSIHEYLNVSQRLTSRSLSQAMRHSLVSQTADEVDVRECTCIEIMTRVYPELVRHWRCAGNVEKTVDILIEGAGALMSVDDNVQALAFLNDLSIIIQAVKSEENPFANHHVNQVDDYELDIWVEGKTHSLTGQALYHVGRIEEAMVHFYSALKILGSPQPETKAAIDLKIISESLKQWKHYIMPQRFRKVGEYDALVEQARCLSHIFHEHQKKRKKREALMSVLQQLNMVEEADSNVHELILAYNCVMECCQLLNWPKMGERYERKAQIRCLNTIHSKDSLVTIGHFYFTSQVMRLSWGKIEDSIEAGYTGDKILSKVHENDLRVCVLPYLCISMLMAGNICNAVETLQQLHYVSTDTDDFVGKTWYYACCMDFILETGVQVEPISKVLTHASEAKNDVSFEHNHMPLYYLASCLALFYQRFGATHKRIVWQEVAEKAMPHNMRTAFAMHVYLKHLEIKLVEFSRLMAENNQKKARDCRHRLEAELVKVTEDVKCLVFLKPRFLHYKAYSCIIRNERRQANRLLKTSLKKCKKQKNDLETQFIAASKSAWFDADIARKRTKEIWNATLVQIEDEEESFVLEWHEAKNVERLIFYSLPLPRMRAGLKRK